MRGMGLPGCLRWEFGLDAGRANPPGAIVKEGKALLMEWPMAGGLWGVIL